MSLIDNITAVLAVPGVADGDSVRNARPGEAELEAHFAAVAARFEAFTRRQGSQASGLDAVFSEVLGTPVNVDEADFTWYEKKGTVYPAIVIPAAGIRTTAGEPAATLVTERLRDGGVRTRLAEALGQGLGVDWASIFTTFGPSG